MLSRLNDIICNIFQPILKQQKKNRTLRTWLQLIMTMRNFLSRAPVVAPGGPVVCLTSYNQRLHTVYLTIESIGRGTLKPSRLILWVDENEADLALTPTVGRLKNRGLEVRLCPNYGPHKKYFPYVARESDFSSGLVTADDDVFYPPNWLATLSTKAATLPGAVICYRAHRVKLTQSGFAPYKTWPECTSTEPSLLHFATGVSGVFYPPAMLRALKDAGDAFQKHCPKADDIWLHFIAFSHDIPISQVGKAPVHFVESVNTRASSLHITNVTEGGNDQQLAQTYPESLFAKLLQASLRDVR